MSTIKCPLYNCGKQGNISNLTENMQRYNCGGHQFYATEVKCARCWKYFTSTALYEFVQKK